MTGAVFWAGLAAGRPAHQRTWFVAGHVGGSLPRPYASFSPRSGAQTSITPSPTELNQWVLPSFTPCYSNIFLSLDTGCCRCIWIDSVMLYRVARRNRHVQISISHLHTSALVPGGVDVIDLTGRCLRIGMMHERLSASMFAAAL